MPIAEHLTVAAVARLLKRDVRTVHRMIERGDLAAVKAHDGLRAPYLIDRKHVTALVIAEHERAEAAAAELGVA